jgi:hypothetical protein
MQHLEISGAVRPIEGLLGVKGLMETLPAPSSNMVSKTLTLTETD